MPQIPSPRTRGRIITKGIKSKTCLSKDKAKEGIAFPKTEKRPELTP